MYVIMWNSTLFMLVYMFMCVYKIIIIYVHVHLVEDTTKAKLMEKLLLQAQPDLL